MFKHSHYSCNSWLVFNVVTHYIYLSILLNRIFVFETQLHIFEYCASCDIYFNCCIIDIFNPFSQSNLDLRVCSDFNLINSSNFVYVSKYC